MIKDLQMNEMRRNDDAMKYKCLYQNYSCSASKLHKIESKKDHGKNTGKHNQLNLST